MNTYCVYCLIDPTDGKKRYVGRTKNPERRLKQYKVPSRSCSAALWHWLLRLKIAGLEPQMEILATTRDYHKSLRWEREWIEKGLAENWGILNVSVKGRHRLIDPFTLKEVESFMATDEKELDHG